MDVLRPAVELINFNLNVIKICGFPAFSLGKKKPRKERKGAVQESAVLLSSNTEVACACGLCTWPVHVCKSPIQDAFKKVDVRSDACLWVGGVSGDTCVQVSGWAFRPCLDRVVLDLSSSLYEAGQGRAGKAGPTGQRPAAARPDVRRCCAVEASTLARRDLFHDVKMRHSYLPRQQRQPRSAAGAAMLMLPGL